MSERNERTGAELLRDATRLMRERANGATPGRWEADCEDVWAADDKFNDGSSIIIAECFPPRDDQNAEHIASWHPAVALAVADWLDWVADAWDQTARIWNVDRGEKHGRWNEPTEHQALTVARAYLAAPVSAGEPKEGDA